MSHRCDYDAIARRYESPERAKEPDEHLLAFVAARGDGRLRALDVGCGTGLQQTANRAALPDAVLVGLDRSTGMLGVARGNCATVAWVRGDGPVLPFADACFDYVSSQFAYQHMDRRVSELVAEVHRVLRAGGRFVMTNADPWGMVDWPVYTYFPASEACDKDDFVPAERFAALMERAGFSDVRTHRWTRAVEERLEDAVAYASERHRTSQFMVIDDAAYEAGLRRLRETVGERGPDAVLRYELGYVTIVGDR